MTFAAPRLLAIVGPTGTGKSALAMAVAGMLGGEIVGCDALQVYRGFDRGTAKPGAGERARVPHHLVDVLDPGEDCTLADFVRMADAAIAEIDGRGRVPVVVGGTGLYLRGLLRGVVDAPARDEALRRRLRALAERHGSPRLHRWLQSLDPASAARLAPRDAQRVVRALELALSSDESWGERLDRRGTWGTAEERYPALKVGLDMDRTVLAARLALRVDAFYSGGLVEEVRALLAAFPRGANAFKAIGYREIAACLDEGRDPEDARPEIVRNTRRYAKRQRTWFRRETGVVWLDALAGTEALRLEVVRLWREGAMLYSPPDGNE